MKATTRKIPLVPRRLILHSGKAGLAPGTPVFVGEQKLEKPSLDIIEYGPEHCNEHYDVTLEDCQRAAQLPNVKWINVNGIHDIDLIGKIGSLFNLHPLTLEDILNTTQRPKTEEFPSYVFIVLKVIICRDPEQGVQVEQLSLILGENFVLSFQESKGDIFNPLRERIRAAKGRIRTLGSDYLAYALMDSVVDHYFLALECIGEYIEAMDEAIVLNPDPAQMKEIHRLKRVVLTLRKAVWPLRDEIGLLLKLEARLVSKNTKTYLRDLYDHTVQVIDMVENFRGVIGGMHETFLSSSSNRMNDIMKLLTVMSTIFIPLTFVTGVYGMNFEGLPGADSPWGFSVVMGVMLLCSLLMLWYFRRRKWL